MTSTVRPVPIAALIPVDTDMPSWQEARVALSRSENMSRIRSVDTEPELIVRRALTQAGLRYRLQQKTPGGKADLVIPSRKFALFIDGCFWHGCPEHYVHPRTNWPFWDKKLRENVDRDRRQTKALVESGWRFLRVWEHEVHEAPMSVVDRIRKQLDGAPRARPGWRVVYVRPTGIVMERRVHEDLMNQDRVMETVRKRMTTKRGRVNRGTVSRMSAPGAMTPRHENEHPRKPGSHAS